MLKKIILVMSILSFFSCNNEKNKNVDYENLTSELKGKYQNELKRDSNKNIEAEFIRTTNLENKIINKYGFNGNELPRGRAIEVSK